MEKIFFKWCFQRRGGRSVSVSHCMLTEQAACLRLTPTEERAHYQSVGQTRNGSLVTETGKLKKNKYDNIHIL